MNQIKIGQFIAKCRKDKNLTQEQLAEKLGVSNKSISKWENGKCMPDLSLFHQLCKILDITINDLMSGEKVDNQEYVNKLETNIVNMVSDIKRKEHKKKVKTMIICSIFIVVLWILTAIYNCYEIDVKYDSRVMNCNITENKLQFIIKGQSVLNTKYTSKRIDNKTIYFFHSTINLYNKRRSNWEYSQSMANLLDNKVVKFNSFNYIDINSKNIEVYYTNSSIKKIEKANKKELNDIIKKSYLMCES